MSAYFDDIDLDIFNLGDLNTFQSRDVTKQIVQFNVSLSMSGSSQVSVSVLDPAFTFAKNNYFQIRRDIYYRHMRFEISAVETQRSASVHPLYNLECRSKAVQLMKRDKKPEAYRGMTAYDFAFAVAKRFELNFIGEKTAKKQSIVKAKSKDADDSVWTVLQSLASEQKFVCFESEGTLFFCSEKFLLGKWGSPDFSFGEARFIPFFYPESTDPVFESAKNKYVLLEQPTLRRSDDDISAAEGTLIVDRFNGIHLRPGMTIYLGGIPDFESFYLITDVSYSEGTPDPVQVQFRVPVDPTKEKISTSTAQGSSGSARNTGTNNLSDPPGTAPVVPQGTTDNAIATYARNALGRMRYRGSNGALIVKAVVTAVNLLQKKLIPPGEVLKGIRTTKGLTELERNHAESIYVMFVSGDPVTRLGAAGGLTPAAINQRLERLNAKYDTVPTNVTPTNRTTTQQTLLSPKPQDLELALSYIDDYINKNEKSNKQLAQTLAKLAAKDIFNNRPTKQAKIGRIKSLYSEWSARPDWVKYNALRQARVLNILIPDNKPQDGIPASRQIT